VDAFLNAKFNTETGRYQTRFKMIQDMESSS